MSIHARHRAEAARVIFAGQLGRGDQKSSSAMCAGTLNGSQSGAILSHDEQLGVEHPVYVSGVIARLTRWYQVRLAIYVDFAVEMVGDQCTSLQSFHPTNRLATPVAAMRPWSDRVIQDDSRFQCIAARVSQWMGGIPRHPACRWMEFLRRSFFARDGVQSFPTLHRVHIPARTTLSRSVWFPDDILDRIRMPRRTMRFCAVQHRPILTLTQEYDNG